MERKRRRRRAPRSKWDEDLFEAELINADHAFSHRFPFDSRAFELEDKSVQESSNFRITHDRARNRTTLGDET